MLAIPMETGGKVKLQTAESTAGIQPEDKRIWKSCIAVIYIQLSHVSAWRVCSGVSPVFCVPPCSLGPVEHTQGETENREQSSTCL